jgi:cellulose synthase/poly-beta-1,6-N-acetylglucosamine synthase-like glycosyltransferase/beta-mannanase
MKMRQKVVFALLVFSTCYFIARYFLWWIQAPHVPTNFSPSLHVLDYVLFFLLSFVVFIGPLLRISTWFALWHMKKPVPMSPPPGLRVAFLTCYVPGKEPLEMLENTLIAMRDVSYPHDTWVLDEGDSSEVKLLCQRLGVSHFSRKGIEKYNGEKGLYRTKTKAGNHNAWRDIYEDTYDIVAQVDMDHVPQKNYFLKTLGYFRDAKVGVIGMPQVYKNLDNWIAKGAAEQSYFFQGPMQQGFFGCDMPFLIGTSHIYRTQAMKQIGGYAPTIVEDHLTGMHFYANGWKGVFVPEVLAAGEGPFTWKSYFSQQMRWSYGLFEILFKHTPFYIWKLSWKKKINYFFAQLYYFSGVSVIIGMILTTLYLGVGIRSASMNLSEWIFYAFPPFALATAIQIYTHRFSINPKNEPIFGYLGMFLQLGANLVYTKAFFSVIFGQNLQYAVTEKTKQRISESPLSVFTFHIIVICILSVSLVMSFYTQHAAIQLRLWAIFNIITLSAVVVSSYASEFAQTWSEIQKPFLYPPLRYAILPASFAIIVGITLIVVPQRPQLVEAFFSPQPLAVSKDPIYGKILPPLHAFVGIAVENNATNISAVEQQVQKKFAVVNYYQAWGTKQNRFQDIPGAQIANDGKILMVSWEPWKPVAGFARNQKDIDQPQYRLARITEGDFDGYITDYAHSVKAYNKPVFIRFAHEMNGNWYPWGGHLNTPQDFIAAWRHIHDIFEKEGVRNVTWVWAPNEMYEETAYSNDILLTYPGDEYVDWVGLSSFNWAGLYKNNVWRTPQSMFEPTVQVLATLHKPILIAETATAENGNANGKAIWITQLSQYIQNQPLIKGVIWFNVNDTGIDWRITSTKRSVVAFHNAFGNYFENDLKSEVLHVSAAPQSPSFENIFQSSFPVFTATKYF